ncbi:TIM44-related membrane protein TimA [Caulobacter vibrioides]|uniref:Tim44-like domain protein n=1 Tax=Caulobacter vibrioides (strain NA1000 / CB15N) TaxID=565050 RepID=A0A0H3CE89_CAUVN|nr:TIM44-related membrane protein TimA [Caulobacter vibrioides]YP_002519230.2 Tim44-like domain protein [Caulobacter vibrioides NA1000]ACL97322.2 Tim44-like domain protein [Caulobacter vibrioides NA1000]QXZ54044.1 TIM44-related membrane protein TimA [Caulobacter vibrioides]
MPDPDVFQILFLAAVAALVLYQLYSTLGRRVGRQPEDAAVTAMPGAAPAPVDPVLQAEGVATLRARQPDFDPARFLMGVRAAYEQIVKAYAEGDRETLTPLLAPDVMDNFERAMVARETAGRTEKVEFLTPPRVDLERVDVVGDTAKAVVRILAEVRTRTKDERGEGVDDRRTAELWTFEREVKSTDPNWHLTFVAAAEA